MDPVSIEEISAPIEEEKKAHSTQQDDSFHFVLVPNDAKLFPNFKLKEVKEKFYQWGLHENNLVVAKFRFN